MENKIIIKAGLKRHRSILGGIFVLLFLVSLTLASVLAIWTNAGAYMESEMERAGYGELTAWVAGVLDMEMLAGQIGELEAVEQVAIQKLIFSEYEIKEAESDSEGQLIPYEHPGMRSGKLSTDQRYRFFSNDLSGHVQPPEKIERGQVYVPPSLISMMGVKIGDKITFPIARNGNEIILTVKGFYEDPFMGSSMIGMKGFLISNEDYEAIRQIIQEAGMDALARDGAMLHVFTKPDSDITAARLNQLMNEQTSLPMFTEFVHSKSAMLGFMLILQNAFSGLFTAFAVVLLFVVLVVIAHSISGLLEQEYVNLGILKTMGLSGGKLCRLQLVQYLAAVIPGMLTGIFCAAPVSRMVTCMTLTTTGVLIPVSIPAGFCMLVFSGILLILAAFIYWKLQKIKEISPMGAIRGETSGEPYGCRGNHVISPKHMEIQLALRQVLSGKDRYVSACIVAVLLTFFASLAGRMDSWLGPDGRGMMDAFNPADHDIGVQALGELDMDTLEQTVLEFTGITDSYLLAMPDVNVNGINYSANVITEPERFHIQQGETCKRDTEVVLTESAAADLGVAVGEIITVSGERGSSEYTVSGIYQCANDMGNNIGMSREGYLKIGQENEHLWCYHYFLEDPSLKGQIIGALEASFGGDVHVHENSWPGLSGIISAMQGLLLFLYFMVILFVLIVTVMTGSKILQAEQRDMGIYKAVGFSFGRLRMTFALRFGMVAAAGSLLGILFAAILTDPLVASVMRFAGISNFSSSQGIVQMLFPAAVVTLLFVLFSWGISGKIKKVDLNQLISE